VTETSSPILNEIELDALTELVNIGVSRAATSLRDMIGEQVHLSVPNVSLVGRSEAFLTSAKLTISSRCTRFSKAI